jgi:MSHA pilin protein MshC
VELITVMIITGILAAVAIPRLIGGTEIASRNFHTDIQSALRYAHKVAMSHRRMVCANIGANSVVLTIASDNAAGAACNKPLNSPDGRAYSSQDPTVTASGTLIGALFFQPTGQITLDAGGNNVAAPGSINVVGADSIRIDGATGHVE